MLKGTRMWRLPTGRRWWQWHGHSRCWPRLGCWPGRSKCEAGSWQELNYWARPPARCEHGFDRCSCWWRQWRGRGRRRRGGGKARGSRSGWGRRRRRGPRPKLGALVGRRQVGPRRGRCTGMGHLSHKRGRCRMLGGCGPMVTHGLGGGLWDLPFPFGFPMPIRLVL